MGHGGGRGKEGGCIDSCTQCVKMHWMCQMPGPGPQAKMSVHVIPISGCFLPWCLLNVGQGLRGAGIGLGAGRGKQGGCSDSCTQSAPSVCAVFRNDLQGRRWRIFTQLALTGILHGV
jgi:hypothetical protein